VLGEDPFISAQDETFVTYQSKGPAGKPGDEEIFTYATWWFMCGPEAYGALSHRCIGKIHLPTVIMRGETDPHVDSWVPKASGAIAREMGNQRVRIVQIPGEGHDGIENPETMLDEIIRLVSA